MITKIILIICIAGSALGVFHYANQSIGVEDDNPVEELAEEVLEDYTGISLDLTPETLE